MLACFKHRPSFAHGPCCRLCGHDVLTPMYVAKGYHVARCPICHFVEVVEKPSDEYLAALYATLHTTHAKYRDHSAAQKENKRRVEIVGRMVPKGAMVLDAGCATGDFIAEAKNHFYMYGVDISHEAIEVATARFPEMGDRLKSSELEDLKAEWPKFDAVCLWDVIEHLWDPVTVYRELMCRLKPGGYLFLSTPNILSLSARVLRSRWAFMTPPYHLGFFSRRSFRYMLDNNSSATIASTITKGKWTNLSFVLYKLNQMSRHLAPQCLLKTAAESWWGGINVYIPTNDILYIVVRNGK